MSDFKNPLASKTIWGGIIMALPVIGSLLGFEFGDEKIAILNAAYDTVSTFVGAALVLWGRWTAEAPLGFKSLQ